MKLYRATVSVYSMRKGDLVLAERISDRTNPSGAQPWIIATRRDIKMVQLFIEDLVEV